MSDDDRTHATIAEDRCRELEMERDKWKDAYNDAMKELPKLREAARPRLLSRTERAVYADAEAGGEARALRREEHLCNDCFHAHVCEVAATLDRHEGTAPVVWRCRGYISIESLRGEGPQE